MKGETGKGYPKVTSRAVETPGETARAPSVGRRTRRQLNIESQVSMGSLLSEASYFRGKGLGDVWHLSVQDGSAPVEQQTVTNTQLKNNRSVSNSTSTP